jgi:hypothetical protein
VLGNIRPTDGRVAAAAVLVASVLALAVAVALDLAVDPAHRAVLIIDPGWLTGGAGLALAVPGALLLSRRPRHPVAWVLCAAGLMWCLDGTAAAWLAYATRDQPPLAGAGLAL